MHDKLVIPARLRGSWECVDLGIALAREKYRYLFSLFFIPAFFLGLVLFWLFPEQRTWLPALVVWWLKPLFERPLLLFLSRYMFGQNLTTKELLGELKGLLRPGLFARLTYARLSPGRSFYMPIRVLEKQKGSAYSKRRDLLKHSESAHTWLTIIGIHIEYVIIYSIVILFFISLPSLSGFFDFIGFIESNSGTIIITVFSILLFALFAPFYVAAGFMLYLNRRIKLEGWDIEVTFKSIVSRLKKQRQISTHKKTTVGKPLTQLTSGKKTAKNILVCLLTICSFLSINPVFESQTYAQQVPKIEQESLHLESAEYISKADAQHTIKALVDSEEIKPTTIETNWERKKSKKAKKNDIDFSPNTSGNFEVVAKLIKFIAVVVIFSIFIYLIYFYKDVFQNFSRASTQTPIGKKNSLMPMAKKLSNVPVDFLTIAQEKWNQQEPREAMSLLYRGSLMSLVKKGCNTILAASTENECLSKIRPFENARYYPLLRTLTREWQFTAYAERITMQETFLQLIKDIQRELLTVTENQDAMSAIAE